MNDCNLDIDTSFDNDLVYLDFSELDIIEEDDTPLREENTFYKTNYHKIEKVPNSNDQDYDFVLDSIKKKLESQIYEYIINNYFFNEINVVKQDNIVKQAELELKKDIFENIERILNYNKKIKIMKANINRLFQQVNIIKERYKLYLDNYNIFDIFPEDLKKLLKMKMLLMSPGKRGKSFYIQVSDILRTICNFYNSSLLVVNNFLFTSFITIISDIGDIFCMFKNRHLAKIFCFKYFPTIYQNYIYTNYLNIDIKLDSYEDKRYAKISKIEFDKRFTTRIKNAIDIFKLMGKIGINANNIIFIKEKDSLYDILTVLKIIKIPSYKQLKEVIKEKIIIFSPEQFELIDEYSNIMEDLYGNKSSFYEEVGSLA